MVRPCTSLPERFIEMRVGKSALSDGEKERGAEELRTRVCIPALSLFSQVPVPHVTGDGAYATDR